MALLRSNGKLIRVNGTLMRDDIKESEEEEEDAEMFFLDKFTLPSDLTSLKFEIGEVE